MNKRPGHITVTVETGFCSFCDRTRNLRHEERQLGTLIRTVIACESCHRVLSSTIGVAGTDAPAGAPPAEISAAPAQVEPAEGAGARPARAKPAATPKPRAAAAKPKAAGASPRAPANRRTR